MKASTSDSHGGGNLSRRTNAISAPARRRALGWQFMGMLLLASAGGGVFAAGSEAQQAPLYDDGVLIRVPVRGLGETLYFMVDTGCSLSALDTKYEKRLGEPTEQVRAVTPGKGDGVMNVYPSPDLQLGGKSLGLQEIGCTEMRMARWVSGQPCDGVLGMDFFEKHIVSIDFDNKLVSVYEAVPAETARSAVTVILKPMLPHWTARVLLNRTHTVDLLVDTGDSSSLSLNEGDWQSVFSGEQAEVAASTVGTLPGQVTMTRNGLVPEVALGHLSYANLRATSIPNPACPSDLGLNFFRRHTTTFAFQKGLLYLQPGKTCSDPDKCDLSGLHLLRIHGQTVVYSVDSDSPASKAGVQPKDVILSVNNRDAHVAGMETLRELLEAQEGNKISLKIKRGDGESTVQFSLKSTL